MRAQVSLEVMTYMVIMLLMLTLVSYVAFSKSGEIYREKINLDAKRVTKLLAIEINTAVGVGDGYKHSFFVPEHLYGDIDYTISVLGDYQRVYSRWGGNTYTVPILTGNITGDVTKGLNFIKNEDGLIRFE